MQKLYQGLGHIAIHTRDMELADRYGVAAPGDGIAVPRTGRTRAEG